MMVENIRHRGRRSRHYLNQFSRRARTFTMNGRTYCQFCAPTAERCGADVYGHPCTREAGHIGECVACTGAGHAQHNKHDQRRSA